jgi:anti-anti-sigma regulatory factor
MSLIRGISEGDGLPMAGWQEGEPVYSDKQLVIRHTIPPNGLSCRGVIDLFNVDSVAATLASHLDGDSDIHIDLSQVEFCDVSGIRAMVSISERLADGRRLVLHGLPPLLAKVMTLVGWGELPTLEICDCRREP